MQFFNPTVCAEILAFFTALFALHNKGNTYWRLFMIYLLLVIVLEAVGFSLAINKKINYPVYNLLILVQALFFSFLFYQFNTSKKIRQWLMLLLFLFICFFIFEGLGSSFLAYNKSSRQIFSFYIVLFCCIYYFSILQNDEIIHPLKHPPFWIITGLFFFYFGSAAMFAFFDKASKSKQSGDVAFYYIIMGYLSCILYGSWIIGFICRKIQTQPFRP